MKGKGFDAPPAVGDAENPTPGEELPAAATAAPAPANGAAAASETQPTPPQPAGKRTGGGRC